MIRCALLVAVVAATPVAAQSAADTTEATKLALSLSPLGADRVERLTFKGDTAKVTVDYPTGGSHEVVLVKREGKWIDTGRRTLIRS